MCLKIKDGALFISDAHENDKRDGFYRFLLKIKSKELDPPQIFLMGDMFDLLIGEVKYLKEKYKKYIGLIEEIAKDKEVFYFEGNHDFALKSLFKNTKVIDIAMQPAIFYTADKKVLLSHGDKCGGVIHTIYTKIIRNLVVLKMLDRFDRLCGFCISKKIEKDLLKKNICLKIDNFQEIVEDKINNCIDRNIELIAEGHYHQNRSFKYGKQKYINFSSFACNQSYFIVQLSTELEFIEIKLRGNDV
ncbi:MAG: UDP-2,3-diacylglucosamine diphosphatase [Sulfurospirillum sp.]